MSASSDSADDEEAFDEEQGLFEDILDRISDESDYSDGSSSDDANGEDMAGTSEQDRATGPKRRTGYRVNRAVGVLLEGGGLIINRAYRFCLQEGSVRCG